MTLEEQKKQNDERDTREQADRERTQFLQEMRYFVLIIGIIIICLVLLRNEQETKKASNFFDELWIRLNDVYLLIRSSLPAWIEKSKSISLEIINIFFTRKTFSLKNYCCSLLFIFNAIFFHFFLLCVTFICRYGCSMDKIKALNYGLVFFVPMHSEISITPIAISFNGLSMWHCCIIAAFFLLISIWLLFACFLVQRSPLWVGGGIAFLIAIAMACCSWTRLGDLIQYQNYLGDNVAHDFMPYSECTKIIILGIRMLILPAVLMAFVFLLRHVFLSCEKISHYFAKLLIMVIFGYLLFCYFVSLCYQLHFCHSRWWIGVSDFLPAIFIPIALLASLILVVNFCCFALCFLLAIFERIIYIFPKYQLLRNDKILLSFGFALICLSLLDESSLARILEILVNLF